MKKQKLIIRQGSVTVEAAFVFPVFFFALMVFLYFFQFMLIRAEVQKALFQTASFCSQYVYFTEKCLDKKAELEDSRKDSIAYQGTLSEFSEGILDMALVNVKFQSCLNKKLLKNPCLVFQTAGISLLQSELMEKGADIDIIAAYRLKFPLPFFEKISFPVTQQAKTKAFLGKSMQGDTKAEPEMETTEEMVYITELGTVYHCSRECTYLKPSIRQAGMEELKYIRNENGGIYISCDSCCKKKTEYKSVYITTWGKAYHSSLDCSGLKRTIREENRNKAENEGYRACSKCGRGK